MRSRCMLLAGAALAAWLSVAPPAVAWDAAGHRMVAAAALEGALRDNGLPQWLAAPDVRARLEFQSGEPDRWRGQPSDTLRHAAHPDHYIDVEDLEPFGLTLRTLPPLRFEYLKAMVAAQTKHPDRFTPYDIEKDPSRQYEWPGFAPYALTEYYAKLQASFRMLRILEALDERGRDEQIAQEKANIIYHMGMLAHFVGDVAQPLHTTKHHHGWIGPNPNGYTTEYGIHSYIDGRLIVIHDITTADVLDIADFSRRVDPLHPWNDVIETLERSFAQVEPLYQLHKSGELEQESGRAFIVSRLSDAASTLAALYRAAWESSIPEGREIRMFQGWTPPVTTSAP